MQKELQNYFLYKTIFYIKLEIVKIFLYTKNEHGIKMSSNFSLDFTQLQKCINILYICISKMYKIIFLFRKNVAVAFIKRKDKATGGMF